MDKNSIKKYAVWAREELIKRVSAKAQEYGITEENIVDANAESINGHVLSKDEISQRRALIKIIQKDGFQQTIDEVAYTWFNRFCALRFMEVNNYLPSRVRIFTDENGTFNPQIMTEAIHLDLSGLDKNKVIELKQADKKQELYKYLIITQCNALSAVLPQMFQRIADYTELLFPDNILREGSVVEQLVTSIPEDDWKDAVQIIGWLYQYYNSIPKDKVFANLKKNIKIRKEDIPAATQLFTPDWIVRYMVENSLGRIFVDHRKKEGIYGDGRGKDEMPHSESEAERIAKEKEIASEMGWKFYIPEAEQTEEVRKLLDEQIEETQNDFNIKKIKVIDPCMGSGHILVYAFDVLMQIYLERGYEKRDAVKSIIENNLYGLDIDERASQLAYFAVMMVAVKYDNRFLTRTSEPIPQPNVFAIVESNHVDKFALEYFINGDEKLATAMKSIISDMTDAKEYGSIIDVKTVEFDALFTRFDEVYDDVSMEKIAVFDHLLPLVKVAYALSHKYDVVVTNPPYMGAGGMDETLCEYVKSNYPDSKSDLSTVCMEKTISMCKQSGYMSMINIPVWMFLSSYEKLRQTMLNNNTIINMVHPGRGIFGSDFGTTTFVIAKRHIRNFKGLYRRLFDKQGEVESIEMRKQRFFEHRGCFTTVQDNFSKIPGKPIAYWASKELLNDFLIGKRLDAVAKPKQGIKTADKDRFLRLWQEIEIDKMSIFNNRIQRWFPCNKGGSFRKWYGNNEYVVDWENNGYRICNFRDDKGKLKSRPQNLQYMLREGLTYTNISISSFGVRYSPAGFIYDAAGSGIFCDDNPMLIYVLGFLTSTVAASITKITSPTMSFEVGQISTLPFIYRPGTTINNIVNANILLSKNDWDSFETSWDFVRDPIVPSSYQKQEQMMSQFSKSRMEKFGSLSWHYDNWVRECRERFNTLKANEEELNRLFIDIYGLQDELTPDVENKDVTVHYIADTKESVPESLKYSNYLLAKKDVVKFLISYAVGCMFGRYSLDVDGLVYAGGNFDEKYCRWMEYFGDKANDEINEQGGLVNGGWAGSGNYQYDGIRGNGEWIKATFAPDTDNIIPICDDEYFDDDIVGRFVKFVATVYGTDSLEANLRFIADALGGKGSPKEVIRNYFLNDFYADHLKIYQKHPIYWLFDSGKKGGFKALIYMHRYQPDTIARMRTDYVHEQQARYRTAIDGLENRMKDAGTGERVMLQKELSKLQEQDTELRTYEEKIHHLADQMIRIDLDDGVKHNYAIFKDVLAPIK